MMRTSLVLTVDNDVLNYFNETGFDPSAVVNKALRKEMARVHFNSEAKGLSTEETQELETLLDEDTAAGD